MSRVGARADQGDAADRGPGLFRVPQVALVVADQVLLSGGNFLTLLMLGRWLAPAAFGSFALGYAALLLAKNVHLALVTTPLMSIGGGLEPGRLAQYRAALLRVHLLICLLAGLALAGGGWALATLRPQAADPALMRALLPALVAAMAALLWQEFVRRGLLTAQRRGATLLNDIVRYGIQLPAILALKWTGHLGVATALLAVAAGSAVGGLLGLVQERAAARAPAEQERAWFAETFGFGKWLAGHYAGVWIIERWYMVGVAALLSTADVGALAACVTLLGVTNIFYLSLENYATPILARLIRSEGLGGFRLLFLRLLVGGGAVFGAGCLAVATFGEPLLTGVFGLKYTGYGWLLGLVALQAFVGFFARVSAIGLKILRRSREVFWAYVGAAAVTVVTSAPLISHYGLPGAGWGLIAAQLALAVPLTFWLFGNAAEPARPAVNLTRCETRG